MKKLAIITTHPIQYNAPWFAMLAREKNLQLKVFYTWSQKQKDNYDPDFKQDIQWDIPLLEGYAYQFIKNTAAKPGLNHFKGIKCPTLIKEIKNWQATHILVFGWNFKAHFKAMRYFKGKVPVLFRGDSTLLDYDIRNIRSIFTSNQNKSQTSNLKSYFKYKLRKSFLTYVYKYIDTACYVGTNNKEYFLTHGLNRNQLVYVPHAIENERFFDNEERQYEVKASKWRDELGIRKDDVVVLFAGKFEQKKNPLLLLEAFKSIVQTHTHLKLIFIGSGILEAELKEHSQNISGVYFLPFQNQSMMPIAYRLCDIFCLPSQGPGETWGLAINEALACARPVIVSNKVGCAIDLIPNSFCFESGNINSLKHILSINILQNPINKKERFQHIIKPWNFNTLANNLITYIKNDC